MHRNTAHCALATVAPPRHYRPSDARNNKAISRANLTRPCGVHCGCDNMQSVCLPAVSCCHPATGSTAAASLSTSSLLNLQPTSTVQKSSYRRSQLKSSKTVSETLRRTQYQRCPFVQMMIDDAHETGYCCQSTLLTVFEPPCAQLPISHV